MTVGQTGPFAGGCRYSLMTLSTDIPFAAFVIRSGGLVAFPTETVYGLGADAFNPAAAARIFELKGRPRFDPLIVHIADAADLDRLAAGVSGPARHLARRFWPGPLTIVVPKAAAVPDIVTAGLDTVAVRMPDHPMALELIRAAGRPIAAPSANRFGCVSPTRAEHVEEQFGAAAPLVLDGGPCRVGLESTILSFVEGPPILLRPGGLPVEEIEALIGPVGRASPPAPLAPPAPSETRPLSPGRLPHHYGLKTPIAVSPSPASAVPGGPAGPGRERVGLLTLDAPPPDHGYAAVEVLSASGDLREAAANLFAAMRRLDALALDRIVACLVPEAGLGLAINDRLRRAGGGAP